MQAAISQEGTQIGVCGERNTDAHLAQRVCFHVNRRILCIIAVKRFRPQATRHLSFLKGGKKRCLSVTFEIIESELQLAC